MGFSRLCNARNWDYCALLCGNLYNLSLLVALAVSGLLPPIAPWWDAERLHAHIFAHTRGIQAGTVLFMMAGAFYLPWSAAISKQMKLIPAIDPILPDLQLACGVAGFCSFMVPSVCLSLLTFRDYGPQITQLINDALWISALIPWPIFMVQCWTIAWAIFADRSAKPVLSRSMGVMNFVAPIVWSLAAGVHVNHTGPFAWNGGLAFWPNIVFMGLVVVFDGFALLRALHYRSDVEEGIEA